MTEFTQLSQFGIAGLSTGIIYFVVRYFIRAIEKKDDYIKELINEHQKEIKYITSEYSTTVNNHINSEKELMAEMLSRLEKIQFDKTNITDVLSKNTKMLGRVLPQLEKLEKIIKN